MLFRIVIIILVLAAGYAAFHIFDVRRLNAGFFQSADFTQKSFPDAGNQTSLTIVEFINYDCQPCKKAHVLLIDYIAQYGGINYVARPVPFTGNAEHAALMALAAGLQGGFWEMDAALSGYDGPLDEKFYKETASLYGFDYERLVSDAKSDEVYGIAKENVRAFQKTGAEKVPVFIIGKRVYQLDQDLTLNDLIRMLQHEKRQ